MPLLNLKLQHVATAWQHKLSPASKESPETQVGFFKDPVAQGFKPKPSTGSPEPPQAIYDLVLEAFVVAILCI